MSALDIAIAAGVVAFLVGVVIAVRWLANKRQRRLDAMTDAERLDEVDRNAW